MRAFVGKTRFGNNWDEDFDNTMNEFNTLDDICGVTEGEKLKYIPVMLSDEDLNYYSTNMKGYTNFQDATDQLKRWYNSNDRKARMITIWHTVTKSKAMEEYPNGSEVSVFRKFPAKFSSIRNQLDKAYHID